MSFNFDEYDLDAIPDIPLVIEKSRVREDVLLLHMSGEITETYSDTLHAIVDQMGGDEFAIFIDFEGLEYINSTGMTSLTRFFRYAYRHNVRLVGWNLLSHYDEIFRVTQLRAFIMMVENLEMAYAAVGIDDYNWSPDEDC